MTDTDFVARFNSAPAAVEIAQARQGYLMSSLVASTDPSDRERVQVLDTALFWITGTRGRGDKVMIHVAVMDTVVGRKYGETLTTAMIDNIVPTLWADGAEIVQVSPTQAYVSY
jgi:hypothetical protein